MKKELANSRSLDEITEIENIFSEKLSDLLSKYVYKNKKLETILALIPEGLIFVSEDNTISLCNSFAKQILAVDNLDLVGRLFSDIFHDDIFGISIKEALISLPHPKTIFLELSTGYDSKDIEVYIVRHEEFGVLISLKDRSPYKQLETSLQRYQQLSELGQVVATIAHEIRNPLTGISGYAGLLKSELSETKHIRMVDSIIEGTLSLNTLLTDILEHTKPELLKLKPVNLFNFINKEMVLISMRTPKVSCKIENKNTSVVKSIDENKMKTVLWNLIINAAEASPKKSTVIVSITDEGYIKISDNGNGISTENMKKLFTPFFTTKIHGTGIGLSKAYKVVRAHGGELIAEPNLPKGTSFIIKLPR